MTKVLEVYKCAVCGNMVEMLFAGKGTLVCCGQPMDLLAENTVDAAAEKHVPVIEKTAKGYKVKVGSAPHPMTEEHHIEWIELVGEDFVLRRNLSVRGKPEADFETPPAKVFARELCNLHGLWSSRDFVHFET